MTRFTYITETHMFQSPTPMFAHSNLLKAMEYHKLNNLPDNYSFVYRKIRKDGYYSWTDRTVPYTIRKLVMY
jgi:hypothetical protein